MSVYIPAKVRGPIYAGYAVVGTALGATQVGFASANATQPVWLTVSLSVFAFLGGAIGYTAASNTPAAPSEPLELHVTEPQVSIVTTYPRQGDDAGTAARAALREWDWKQGGDTKADAAYHGKHEGDGAPISNPEK